MYQKTITNEELALLPAATCKGEVIVVSDNDNDAAADYLGSCAVIGFDTETRPSFKKGVTYPLALLQLSGGDRTFLFRVDRMKLSNKIVKILRSKSIIKVGVDIRDDIKKLQKIVSFKPENFMDLQIEIAKYDIEEKSLRKISGIVLKQRVSKAQRLSNWSAQTLTAQQIEYAATDAYITREIYMEFLKNPCIKATSI
ncbi:MAG: 3'-5' exonuclease [Rikenellaceae bacterium]